MFEKLFKKKAHLNTGSNYSLIGALLIHAAKMDNNYNENEKNMIRKAITHLSAKPDEEIDQIFKLAEEKERKSNQIIEFTKEIKKKDMKYRIKIIEILWRIVYSDGTADVYETNLIRRINGLLYVSDRVSGEIKEKIRKELFKP